jgi:hypothetical protein
VCSRKPIRRTAVTSVPYTKLFTSNDRPYGILYSEWTARWWRWLLEQPTEVNPVNDQTGARCFQNQSDSRVWFLAGTMGPSVSRKCTIPHSRSLLFPVINYAFVSEAGTKTECELTEIAKNEIDKIAEMKISLDQIQLPSLETFRVRTPIFEVDLPKDNVFNEKAGSHMVVSDGYWLFCELKPGRHSLSSFGSCLAGTVKIDVHYELTIE